MFCVFTRTAMNTENPNIMLSDLRKLLLLAGVALLVGTAAACDDEDPTNSDPLAAPANVVATATSPTTVAVTWNVVADAESYEVDRALGAGAFVTVATGLQATVFNDA